LGYQLPNFDSATAHWTVDGNYWHNILSEGI
jgi:hypothetical protein